MKKSQKFMVGTLMLSLACVSFSCAKETTKSDGYTMVWQDEFNGKSLNTADWNFEYHEPGWVNNELQSYGDSSKNTYVKGGNLVIQPLKNGKSYTSGRINTQNKHTITYGKVEVRAKVPAGKGFLPAIWMMPNDENLYGQWPKCGEIDIMEVLGDNTKKLYSTLHFGEPHSEGQGTYTLTKGDFSKEFHVYGMEWEPGEIRFYIDGELYHTENDWYTKRPGFGEVTYPAPFDQPFYLILNVAVGGNWPGNPDASTKFDKNAAMYVDYVRVYQKDSYDENVSKPEKAAKFRKADSTGNLVYNGDFSNTDDLGSDKNWEFMTAGAGKATCSIHDNAIHIDTEKAGELDYSVQLVQPKLPMYKGGKYKLSFDISADKDRTAIVTISAPTAGWIRYLNDTKINIGPKKQTFVYDIEMKDADDPNGRLEFNLGNQKSTESVHISNIRFEQTGSVDLSDASVCEPDGNYVFNGKFQEGKNRMDYWTVESKTAKFSVTNEKNVRMLKCESNGANNLEDAKLVQKKIKLNPSKEYKLSFVSYADSEKNIRVDVGGQNFDVKLGTSPKTYNFVFETPSKIPNKDLIFNLGNGATTYVDDVRLQENTLILNGDFSSGMTGYEIYAYTSSDVSYVVDTLNEKSALCIDIENTGDMDWKIQLKQNDVILEKGGKYKISFDAKSTMNRKIMYALQRDGSSDDNWDPYSGTRHIDLTTEFQTFTSTFDMEKDTDIHTILSISMGAVDGKQIKTKHTVVIDNIVLEKLN